MSKAQAFAQEHSMPAVAVETAEPHTSHHAADHGASKMPRKLVIVARDNAALYDSLKRTLGTEPDVEIVYDRRRAVAKGHGLGDSVKKYFSREPHQPQPVATDRRRRQKVDEQIRSHGWAIVREELERLQLDDATAARYRKLREVWPTSERRDADRVGSILLKHDGVCFECVSENASVSLNEVMASVRRMQVDYLLAFTTRACGICTRKSLVGYVRERYIADDRRDR